MKLYHTSESYKLYQGSMLDMKNVIEDNTIDAIITDPPYELGFMGKAWDNSGIAFKVNTWKTCLDVLKPGGYLLAFGGSRTFHRIACAIEDAGFEIRDTVMWLYGSGFPKSMNIGKAIESKTEHNGMWKGWGTALKPSYEPIIIARKPCEDSCVANVLKYGVGGLNIDECRVYTSDIIKHGGTLKTMIGDERRGNSLGMFKEGTENTYTQNPNGRFPANTILTYDDTDFEEVCGGMPYTKSTGESGEKSTNGNFKNVYGDYKGGIKPANLGGLGDSGSTARYFYCAKASKRDRDEGISGRRNTHCTVKPTSLMQYLIRLVTPNDGTILDPFNGSGSTGKAVMYENKEHNKGYKYIGIELEEEYLDISKARIECFAEEEHKTAETVEKGQIDIFEFMRGYV